MESSLQLSRRIDRENAAGSDGLPLLASRRWVKCTMGGDVGTVVVSLATPKSRSRSSKFRDILGLGSALGSITVDSFGMMADVSQCDTVFLR